ncbi:MAG: DUF3883 domain-containing protein [Verrucomicrobia bacterium]|nr:DUF3883 domain-containing protein [Verrucomicrobiota bacterium]MCH8513884.1 DUF3883 domain-containing protein [Kiritimatiellia bacterium]
MDITTYTEFNKALVAHGKTVLKELGLADLIRISNWSGSQALWLKTLARFDKQIQKTYGVKGLSFQVGGRDDGLNELETITNFHRLKSEPRVSHSLEAEKSKLESNIRAAYNSSGNLGDFLRQHAVPPKGSPHSASASLQPSITISTPAFVDAYSDMCARYLQENREEFKDFNIGAAFAGESYKTAVFLRALDILNAAKLRRKHIGSGKIASTVCSMIEINEGKGCRNNMVQWEGKQGPQSRSHRQMLEAMGDPERLEKLETLLYDLYCEEGDEVQIFGDLVSLLGARYDLLAYLFYLKDPNRFLPISPTNFEIAFHQLGIPLQLSGLCSWENYREYLARIRAVQHRLTAYGHPGCQLIDAHTFCWMLAKLTPLDGAYPTITPVYLKGDAQSAPAKATPPSDRTSVTLKTPEDFLNDQKRRNQLGGKSESTVYNAEVANLKAAGRGDLATKVKPVSDNIGLGYDIESFHPDGNPKRIEVKTASVSGDVWQFYLSENELEKATRIDGYVFALVRNPESQNPKIWEFDGPDIEKATLRPTTYHVSVIRAE